MVDAVDKLAVFPMSNVGSNHDARPHTELTDTTVTFLCSSSLDLVMMLTLIVVGVCFNFNFNLLCIYIGSFFISKLNIQVFNNKSFLNKSISYAYRYKRTFMH